MMDVTESTFKDIQDILVSEESFIYLYFVFQVASDVYACVTEQGKP